MAAAAPASTTSAAAGMPPVFQGPTAKERKYDRQLRLWAASGQAALEDANILLVNSGAGVTGVEALKNLVLPGIGKFTILDPTLVTEADLGVNFFLEESDVGKPRAAGTVRLLQELNPDVQGHALTEPVETFVAQPHALDAYNFFIVALPAAPEITQLIADHAEQHQKPAIYFHSLGFLSHFSVQLPHAFPIVDTHPDPATTQDLRLLEPWQELSDFAAERTRGLDQMDEEDHGHVPFVLLLLHYLEVWKASHGGNPPQNYKEKTEFRSTLGAAIRRDNPEGGEENFDEAVGSVLKSLNPHAPSGAVKDVFAAHECNELTASSPSFWLIAHAVRAFYQVHKVLPLPGSVPDMKAKSADYIALQNVYKTKARADVAEVLQTVRGLEAQLGRPTPVGTHEVEAFCKSAGHVKLVRGRRPQIARPQELVAWTERAQSAASALSMPDSLMAQYIAFLAYDSYTIKHRLEAAGDDDYETQVEKMTGIAATLIDDLIQQASTFLQDPEYSEAKVKAGKAVRQLARAQGGELHNIAALTGGMIAQEAIKIITKQYVPVDNVCVFDGIRSKTSVFRV